MERFVAPRHSTELLFEKAVSKNVSGDEANGKKLIS
jgi:hypothetical protein